MEYAAQTSQSYFDDRDHPFNFPGTLHIKTWCLYTKRRGIHSENKDQQYHEPNLIGTMSTLDQFFLYYTSMKLPSQCEVDVKIMFFEQDCQPSWEAWQHSGSLLLQFKESKQNNEPQALDQIWQYLLFSMIGNRLDSDVIGLCLNKHQKQTLIQIWLRRLNRKYELADSILKMISSDLWHVVRKFSRKLEFKYTQHRESIKVKFKEYLETVDDEMCSASQTKMIIDIFICYFMDYINQFESQPYRSATIKPDHECPARAKVIPIVNQGGVIRFDGRGFRAYLLTDLNCFYRFKFYQTEESRKNKLLKAIMRAHWD